MIQYHHTRRIALSKKTGEKLWNLHEYMKTLSSKDRHNIELENGWRAGSLDVFMNLPSETQIDEVYYGIFRDDDKKKGKKRAFYSVGGLAAILFIVLLMLFLPKWFGPSIVITNSNIAQSVPTPQLGVIKGVKIISLKDGTYLQRGDEGTSVIKMNAQEHFGLRIGFEIDPHIKGYAFALVRNGDSYYLAGNETLLDGDGVRSNYYIDWVGLGSLIIKEETKYEISIVIVNDLKKHGTGENNVIPDDFPLRSVPITVYRKP